MNTHWIDLKTYPRKDHFDYFRSLAYPYVGVTCEIEMTEFYHFIKKNHLPFFLSFLYCVNRACNDVVQMRQRIVDDQILEYDYCATSHTVAKADETYAYCTLDARKSFKDYLATAINLHEQAKLGGTIEESAEEAQSLIFISTLPWLSYTSLIQPVPIPSDSNPRITWGKAEEKNGNIVMPVSVLCHHALVDGKHIANFYDALNQQMKEVMKTC